MMTSMKGELTDIKKQEETFNLKNSQMVKAIAKVLKAQGSDDYKMISQTIEPVLINSCASTVSKYMTNIILGKYFNDGTIERRRC